MFTEEDLSSNYLIQIGHRDLGGPKSELDRGDGTWPWGLNLAVEMELGRD
jgi:hypothetical protein